MATRKIASKTSSRAKLNIPSASGTGNGNRRATKKTVNAAKKELKKIGAKGILVAFLVLIVGLAAGAAAYFAVCSKDTFEIIGGDEITITLEDKYVEQGVKIIEFGKDISDKAVIETNLVQSDSGNPAEIGTFYVKYSVDSVKYGKIFRIEKVRLINVVEASEGGE